MTRLQTGSVRLLLAGEFAATACIGFVIIVLASVRFTGHTRGAFDRGSALAVGGLLLLVGLTAAARSLRLRVLIDEDCVAVVGVSGVRRMKLAEIAFIGYSRSSFGRLLFVIGRDGRCIQAWGVSHPHGPLTAEASTAMETLRSAASRTHTMPVTDPLPELPQAPVELTAHPPDGAMFDSPSLSLVRVMLPGQLVAAAVMLVDLGGVQAALPWLFPWIIVAGGALLVLLGVLPMVLAVARLHRTFASGTVAAGGGWVSIKVRTQWRSLDLRRLAGVGAVATVYSLGMFGRIKLMNTLRLIDVDGRRLDIDELSLTSSVLAEIRRFVGSVPQTDLATRILSSG